MESSHYIERDVSWMYFNHRILQEAEKESVPLLERLSFLGIYSNNLDEFFRRTRQTLWGGCADANPKTCCQTIHDCPKSSTFAL